MLVGTMLSTASSVVAQLVTAYQSINEYVIGAACNSNSYSRTWKLSSKNVIQFGLDQLPDASTDEIASFISWCVWTSISGCIIVAFANMCVPNVFLNTLTRLLVCFCLSVPRNEKDVNQRTSDNKSVQTDTWSYKICCQKQATKM